ncbi:MAG: hypothetical protein OK454_11035 [Thaumarchaeota archaeon]|nr:hypothetical protein [Nitrososphaerota archaeon]
MDASPTSLSQHDWFALEDEPLGLFPGEIAIGRLRHCLIEVAKHRLPDGNFPEVIHRAIISGISCQNEVLPQ